MKKKNSLQPIVKENVTKIIVQQLTEYILDELEDGDKLPSEKELIDDLQIGRSSLREALRAVEALGLIEVRAGSGSYVTKDTGKIFRKPIELGLFSGSQSIEELIEARAVFELGLVDLIVDHIDEKALEELEDAVEQMEASGEDLEKVLAADFLFHQILYRTTRNNILYHISDLVYQIISEVKHEYFTKPEHFRISCKLHRNIVEALKENSQKKASEAIGKHNIWMKEVFLTGKPVEEVPT